MTVKAPGRSNWAKPARAVVSFGRTLRPTAKATTPMGTLTQKMSCQPNQVVSAPPNRTPAAIPRLPTAPHRARPRVRCAPE